MKCILSTLVLVTSFTAFGASKLALDVELNPAGSFQATSDKVKGHVTKNKDGTITANRLTVSVETMKTGIDLRDEHFWKHLNSQKFPKAVLSDIKGKDGKATGQLEVAGVKKPIDITYKENGNQIDAKFAVKASDFKLPKAQYMSVGVEDKVSGEASLPFKSI